ncbi:MAG TPA: MerR family transcriptional regulator [Opitutaceae bacterium]|jgi:DNA-binding transcriptional MerR regulator|nr:MerR family transcriptional regulator [Opitutaceae bacterium]
MKKSKKAASSAPLVFEPDLDAVYTLEVVVELTGVSSQTILHYQEQGLISPVAASGSGVRQFNDEALRTLRRLEHLRTRYEMNLRALKFTLGLLDKMESLQADLRARR